MMQGLLFSTGRADIGALCEVAIQARCSPTLKLRFFLAGDVELVRASLAEEGFSASVITLACSPEAPATSKVSMLIDELLKEVTAHPPDLILVAGDRYELLVALTVGVIQRIPLGHISGGECTFGALDEQIRHAMTKAAHLHFVANPLFAKRLRGMGEEPWRIHVTGDPALDRLSRGETASLSDLSELLGFPPARDTILVAYHPLTNEPEKTFIEWVSVAQALDQYTGYVVVTGPNKDPMADELRSRLTTWCTNHPRRRYFENLGQRNFMGLLQFIGCLIGNSSSGLWEAPTFCTPAINIGRRQEGRLRGANIIDLPQPTPGVIITSLQSALKPSFREELRMKSNPYGDGHASPRIINVLQNLPPRNELLWKRFVDF